MIVNTTHGAVTTLVDANSRDVVTKAHDPMEAVRMYALVKREQNGTDVVEFKMLPFYQPIIDVFSKIF